MFGNMFGNNKKNKKKNSLSSAGAPPPNRGHQRMSTEEQINYALQVSLQEAQGNPPPPLPIGQGYDQSLIQATQASMGHQRMTTAEQINLAVKLSLEESGPPATDDKPEETPNGSGPTPGGHGRMNTEQAISIAIAKSLEDSRLPEGPPKGWSVDAVSHWMHGLNDDYESYADKLKDQGIDGAAFVTMSKEDYKSFGIRNRNHRDNIFTAIQNEIQKTANAEEAEPEPQPEPVANLFADPPEENQRKQRVSDSFGGVAGLFAPDAETPETQNVGDLFSSPPAATADSAPAADTAPPPGQQRTKAGNPSFGGIYGIFGSNDAEDEETGDVHMNAPEDDMSTDFNTSLAQKFEEAQKRIERLEKKLDGERREKARLQEVVREEQELRQKAEQELAVLKSSTAAPSSQPEKADGDVELGYITFKENSIEEGHIHKRDPSFNGVSGLFDDIDFNSDDDEPLDEPEVEDYASRPAKGEKDRHKRDPSFSGVADMFDDDEAEEMGFTGPSAVPVQTTHPMSSDFPTSGRKKKRDPSFSGISDLFADDDTEEEEQEMAPVTGAGRGKKKRDPSFSGVTELFAEEMEEDEEEPEEPEYNYRTSALQDEHLEELRAKIRQQEEVIAELEHLKYDHKLKDEQCSGLQRELDLRESTLEKIKQREQALEDENKRLRGDFNTRLQEVSNSNDVSDIIKEELSRTKAELEDYSGRARSVEKDNDQLTSRVSSQEEEISFLKSSVNTERANHREVELELQDARMKQQKAESELQIRKETTIQDNHHESLIQEQMRNQKLEEEKDDLIQDLQRLEETCSLTQESKFNLVIAVSEELDRMRNVFREMSVAQTAAGKAQTVG